MTSQRILIAGIGNIFLGDDAFGVEVVQALAKRALSEEVRLVDFGIRGFDLAYALLDDYETTIMIDATPRGGEPGTLYLIELGQDELNEENEAEFETHAMNPMAVLQLVKTLGGQPRHVLVVGCEPATFGPENEGQMGLSEPVQAAVAEAVTMVEELVTKLLLSDQDATLVKTAQE